MQLKCFSLTYYLRHLAALKERDMKLKRDGIGMGAGIEAVDDDDASCVSTSSLLSNTTTNTATTIASNLNLYPSSSALTSRDDRKFTTRFLPLIVDEEHAHRALPLLLEEFLRLDRYTNVTVRMYMCVYSYSGHSIGSPSDVVIGLFIRFLRH